MVLWQADPTVVRVRWFRAPPGAPLVPQPNPFVSSVWDETKASINPALGESLFARYDPEKGANTEGYAGVQPCGPVAAWRQGGVHGQTPPLTTDALGVSPCCKLWSQLPEGGAGLGGSAIIPGQAIVGLGGVGLGGSAQVQGTIIIGTGGVGVGGTALVYGFYAGVGGVGVGGTAEVDSDVPIIGEIRLFGADVSPVGWLECDGNAVSQSTYSALYAVLATTWGPDSGGNFTLPDFRRRVPMGRGGTAVGPPSNTIGQAGGEEAHLLSAAESGLPSHSHPGALAGQIWGTSGGAGTVQAGAGLTTLYAASGTDNNTATDAVSAHNNVQPSAVVKYMIYAGA